MKKFAACSAALVLAMACGPSGNTVASSARTAALRPSPSAPPHVPTSTTNTLTLLSSSAPADGTSAVSTIKCTGPIGASDPVAFVSLHGGSSVLRDYADPAHPRTVCQLPGMTYVPVIDAHHLLLSDANGYYAVVQVPEVVPTWFQLPPSDIPSLIGVSPNLDQIAYLTQDVAGNTDKIHLVDSAGDHVLASPPNPHAGRCGSPEDSKLGDYQHFGGDFYVLDQPAQTLNSLMVFQNGIVKLSYLPTPPWAAGQQPEFPVWSPTTETLYYRQGGDVWKWTATDGAQKFLQGVSWYDPTISADGKHLAYAVLRGDGLHDVYLVDLARGGAPQVIGKGPRTVPVFLSSNLLWYKSDASGACGMPASEPLVYDLSDGSESASIVDYVGSVWPSTSSNF